MHILPINLPGAVICAVAFGAAFGVGRLLGTSDEGPLMIIAGPLCAALDGSYRSIKGKNRWFDPDSGGNFLCIPIWLLGLFWWVLGVVYTFR